MTGNTDNKQLTETETEMMEASKLKRKEFEVAIKTYGENKW